MAKAKQQNNKRADRWTERQPGEMKDTAAVSVEGQDIYSVTHASIQRIRARFPPCPALSSETWALKRATTVNPSVRRRERGPCGTRWYHTQEKTTRAEGQPPSGGHLRSDASKREGKGKISLRPHGGAFASVSCPVLPRKLSGHSQPLSVTGSVTAKCNNFRWTGLNWKLTFFSVSSPQFAVSHIIGVDISKRQGPDLH